MLLKDFELETRTCTWVSACQCVGVKHCEITQPAISQHQLFSWDFTSRCPLVSPVLSLSNSPTTLGLGSFQGPVMNKLSFLLTCILATSLYAHKLKSVLIHCDALFGWQELRTEMWPRCLGLQAGQQTQSCVSHAAIGWLCLALPTKETPLRSNYREKYKTKGNSIKHCNY